MRGRGEETQGNTGMMEEEGGRGKKRTVWDVLYEHQRMARDQQKMVGKLLGELVGGKLSKRRKRRRDSGASSLSSAGTRRGGRSGSGSSSSSSE